MEKVMNFKRLEVTGTTKEEALSHAPFGIQGDATQAYRNARKNHTGAWTDADEKQFMMDYLAKKSKNLPGVGFSITVESAVADTRERPYSIKNIKGEGPRKWKTFYCWFEKGTDKLIVKVDSTKADSNNAIKKLYANKELTSNAYCKIIKECVEGTAIVAEATYTPSKSSRVGVYKIFGLESA